MVEVEKCYLTVVEVVDRGVLGDRGACDLGSRREQYQLLGCVDIVAPFGHKPEKKADRFRRGSQDLEG